MTAVKNIASRGTSVVCTIHQPSATIFGMFTHLLLLKKGGFTTYFGPIGQEEGDYSVLLDYFSKYVVPLLSPNPPPPGFGVAMQRSTDWVSDSGSAVWVMR